MKVDRSHVTILDLPERYCWCLTRQLKSRDNDLSFFESRRTAWLADSRKEQLGSRCHVPWPRKSASQWNDNHRRYNRKLWMKKADEARWKWPTTACSHPFKLLLERHLVQKVNLYLTSYTGNSVVRTTRPDWLKLDGFKGCAWAICLIKNFFYKL
jgi:hypothetical protein